VSGSERTRLEALARRTGRRPVAVEPLSGDVGHRRYFRLTLERGGSVLGVVYPAEETDSRRRWIAAHEALGTRVRLPELLADDGEGNQLVEDLGREDLALRLSSRPEDRTFWLGRAADVAASIAATPDPGINPPFGEALFRREVDLSREAVFDLLAHSPLSDGEREAHDRWATALVGEILGHPRSLCHRDFHANNLFPAGETVAVIDFQDLRLGPDSYDLASLLWERTTLDWMSEDTAGGAVARFAASRGLEPEAFGRRLRRVLLQRAWKASGTFARAVAGGRGDTYRAYLPAEIALVRSLLTDTPEDRRFAQILQSRSRALC
jgi:aminoglycoside/choline kinase family phosphotransferase